MMRGMARYIAFLRAINLGATRKFAKASIVTATGAAGGTDVQTYINTGNVLLTSPLRSRAKVEVALERAYEEQASFAVPTVVFTPAELVAIADDIAGFGEAERHTIYLLKDAPQAALITALAERCVPGDRIVVRHRAAHVLIGKAKPGVVDPYGVEKRLGVVATNRNRNVITALARMWGTP